MILVVGAAIVRDGTVLAARRTAPTETAGRWELPGGKVGVGERPDRALVREVAEELGCRVQVRRWLDGEQRIDADHVLKAATCTITSGTPVAGTDHDQLRWLGADELAEVDWLEPDRPFLRELRALLLGS